MTDQTKIYIALALAAALFAAMLGSSAWSNHKINKLESEAALLKKDIADKDRVAQGREIEAASKDESQGSLPDGKDFIPVGTQAPLPARSDETHTPQETALQAGSLRSDSVIPNPYGVVPVFHFANNSDLGTQGRSELEAAIPVQDGLNKSVLDMLVAMEFAAYRQRWAAGIETEYDVDGKAIQPFKAGADYLWIADDPNAKFGDFNTADLEQFLKVKDSFRLDMASVTGTPLHYFMQSAGSFPSGESFKKAETRFLAKVRDRQESFGQVWADAVSFALRIEIGARDARLITQWEDPAPMAEREILENILLKKQIGLPVRDALLEAGYGSEDVEAMLTTAGQNPERQ